MAGPGDLVGPYRLLHVIGSGGMGQVFAAIHERMGQQVALKLLLPDAAEDQQIARRFVQEARALAQLEHPGVVRVFQCDRLEDGQVYIAMEHLHGISLRDWQKEQSDAASLATKLALARQVAEAMVVVHQKGIVHRDLKPENVFLCPDADVIPNYRVKILDFGIAKVPSKRDGPALDTEVLTNAPVFLGTATYVAPEQCRSPADVDGRADVYALGVMFFELCAGKSPFVAADRIDVISMHVREEAPPLKDLAPDVPNRLAAFVASMLAKDPAERPMMERCRDVFGWPWESEHDECPMPGLLAFDEAQAELLFGRNKEIEELVELIEKIHLGERRWLQIEGPSGAGKSSLVQAGLLPRLKSQSENGALLFRIARMRPSSEPISNLASALFAALNDAGIEETAMTIEASLRANPDALHAMVQAWTRPGQHLLLVIEQLEELFTIGASELRHFDELLGAALVAPDSRLRLITTLRSDFIHRLELAPYFASHLNQASRYHLRVMQDDALAQVVRGMAQRAGLRLAEGLTERMVRDARSSTSPLPLVGHTLRGLWSVRGGALLSHERYDELGGVSGALSRQAEQLLKDLGDEGRERAQWLLLDLVQVGRGVPDTRRPRTRQEVLAAAGGDLLAEDVLLRLSGIRSATNSENGTGMRIVMLSGGPEADLQQVESVPNTVAVILR